MHKDPDKDLININQLLGEQPTILFIPANQMIPWSVLVIISYFLTMGLFDFGLAAFAIVSLWLCIGCGYLRESIPTNLLIAFTSPQVKIGTRLIYLTFLP